jgi:S-adenosylmethionine hydrolase
MSNSFHGRDLFAPVAAMLSQGKLPQVREVPYNEINGATWALDSAQVIYVDYYGNMMTALQGRAADRSAVLQAGGRNLGYARTFCEVPCGQAFWYENSLGLVEVAVNQGRADSLLGLAPGDSVRWLV